MNRRISPSAIDRMMAALMLLTFVMEVGFNTVVPASGEYLAIQELRDNRAWAGPGYSLLALLLLSGACIAVGGISRMFGWARSRGILAAGALTGIPPYVMYETYVYTSFSAIIYLVWALTLGWLIARPVPGRTHAVAVVE